MPEFHNWSDVALSNVSCIDESVCHIGGFEMGFQIWEWETLQKILQARDTLCICQQGNCVRFCQICTHKLVYYAYIQNLKKEVHFGEIKLKFNEIGYNQQCGFDDQNCLQWFQNWQNQTLCKAGGRK